MTRRTATDFLVQRLGEHRVVVLDGECVDHVSCYEAVLRELVGRVSAGDLALADFSAVEGTPRRITVGLAGGEPRSFDAEGDTDWIDNAAVVGVINRLLADRGDVRRLVEYHGDEFGQESGWVLLTPSEFEALLEFGLTEDHGLTLHHGDGAQLLPVSEDRGGDGPGPWEDAILAAAGPR